MSDNTTSNQSSTGDSKSTPGAVPSSTDGSSSLQLAILPILLIKLQSPLINNMEIKMSTTGGAYSGQNYNANYQDTVIILIIIVTITTTTTTTPIIITKPV